MWEVEKPVQELGLWSATLCRVQEGNEDKEWVMGVMRVAVLRSATAFLGEVGHKAGGGGALPSAAALQGEGRC